MISFLYGTFLGCWRRWFGGGLDFLGDNRALQHIVGFVVACTIFWYNGYNCLQVLLASSILQGLFWAKSHGACYDFGHGSVDVKRYEDLWYWKYLKVIIPERLYYTYSCDFILMLIRYTIPAILLACVLVNSSLLLLGLCVSCVYAVCWSLYDLEIVKHPTELAEFLAGFYVGILLGG